MLRIQYGDFEKRVYESNRMGRRLPLRWINRIKEYKKEKGGRRMSFAKEESIKRYPETTLSCPSPFKGSF